MVEITSTHLIEVGSSAILFIFLWWFLRGRVFLPYIEVIEEREQRTVGASEMVRVREKEKREIERVIAEEVRESRLQGIKLRDAKVKAAKDQAQEMLDQAAAQAQGELDKSRDAIAKLKLQAEQDMKAEIAALSAQITEQVVRSKGAARVIH